jgi:hypothetical protein
MMTRKGPNPRLKGQKPLEETKVHIRELGRQLLSDSCSLRLLQAGRTSATCTAKWAITIEAWRIGLNKQFLIAGQARDQTKVTFRSS